MNDIKNKINELSTMYDCLKITADSKTDVISNLIPSDVRKAIKDVEDEYAPALELLGKRIAELELQVRTDVIALGDSVKSAGITVAYSGGKTVWDSEVLNNYLEKHPKSPIARAKKNPKPYASIYKRGE